MNAKQFFLIATLTAIVANPANAECAIECTEKAECSKKTAGLTCPEECSKNNDCCESVEDCLNKIDGVELNFTIKRAPGCDDETWRTIINSVIDCANNCESANSDKFATAQFINIINTAMAAKDGSISGCAQINVCSKENDAVTTVEE